VWRMRVWGFCLLQLLLIVCGVCGAHEAGKSAADLAEEAEWEHFMGGLRRLEAIQSGESQLTFEPDTKWLKTCGGWVAQEMCSTVFGSGIPEEIAYVEDVGRILHHFVNYWMDYEEKSVVGSCRIFNSQNQTYKSIWRQGLGCTLVEVLTEAELRAQDVGDQTPPIPLDPLTPWPLGEGFFPDRAPSGADLECVARVSAAQFANTRTNTRAIVVVYQGSLVFEEYAAPHVTKNTRLLGWSATKSITQALIGVVVNDGLLNITEPARVPEWYETPGDARQNITVDAMLRMSSGTRWVGDIFPTTECIFWSGANCAHTSALKPLVTPVDTEWNYNSGSSYILSRVVLETRREQGLSPFEWPKRRLFYPIGAHSMYIEYQPNAVFLGGSYGYATARDWARFGLLYQRDGVWIDGTRIFAEGWVKYAGTSSHTNGGYAAHFWKNPGVDSDLFIASGFRNQNVFIFPRQQLVIVRMAMPQVPALPVFDSGAFLRDMLTCFP